MTNRTLSNFWMQGNSIGDEGAAAGSGIGDEPLADLCPLGHRLSSMGGERVLGIATAMHTHMLPSLVICR